MPDAAALHHTCFIVRDLESAAQTLSDTLGIGPWNVWTIEPAECRVHGEESLEAVRDAKAELLRQGRELIQEGSAGDIFDFSYFSFPEIGSAVELLYLDAAQLPPPAAVIGADRAVTR
jgi:hypothetical protein